MFLTFVSNFIDAQSFHNYNNNKNLDNYVDKKFHNHYTHVYAAENFNKKLLANEFTATINGKKDDCVPAFPKNVPFINHTVKNIFFKTGFSSGRKNIMDTTSFFHMHQSRTIQI